MFHTFLNHSSIVWHPDFFHVLATTNSAAMNIVEQKLLQYDWASLGYIPKSEIAGSSGRLIPNFLRKHHNDF